MANKYDQLVERLMSLPIDPRGRALIESCITAVNAAQLYAFTSNEVSAIASALYGASASDSCRRPC